jgi:formate hydrogenlyase subunit 3/multisubunit Na+/H+ antiporter MnhD subunit
MSAALLLLTLGAPLALALLLVVRFAPGRRLALALAPVAALPALLLALIAAPAPDGAVHLPWLLLGTTLGVDGAGRVFLLFTAALWLAAGVHARGYLPPRTRPGYFLFHLLALTGNLGVVLALDAPGFYLFFALMTFAGYGLVVHAASDAARRAGRVYLAMAVVGEALLLAGILLAVSAAPSPLLADVAAGVAGNPRRDLIVALLLAGFGIKAGAIPLHVWLPLAHPVAPTPASAVLSGSMIKAGLLGWLRFLPLGAVALPEWGALLVALGITAAFFGVLVGVTQRDAKTVLAYSTISQMGILNVGVGLALMEPAVWPLALGAVLVYAMHHGVAKGALFLGVSVAAAAGGRPLRLARVGLAFAAVAVAGAPLTSGSVAKGGIKTVAHLAPAGWPALLDWLLPLTGVGTTLLMARFLSLVWTGAGGGGSARPAAAVWGPWAALLAALAVAIHALPGRLEVAVPGGEASGVAYLVTGAWPILLGAALWLGGRRVLASRRPGGRFPEIPAGDLLVLVEARAARLGRLLGREPEGLPVAPIPRLASRWYSLYARSGPGDTARRMEIGLTRWALAAALFALLALLLTALLAVGGGGGAV